ncbi:TetR family transcriptional regulator [Sediminihabitans luteus]|uniref:TetR family transcriptional regulator n=1 Tax=Sediminihabitans luteus TaxID=1138585 RepID=A0A2M9CCZ7_9CELL|nr:TetR family transcriptional regulator [Sediminihabitans luteus]PJJ69265.1 TetR family transcriptional regulator [Sediminihabitans luteus]GII98941.1 hypothetical protein Slu03_13190 [Sediminihabitans luteus]
MSERAAGTAASSSTPAPLPRSVEILWGAPRAPRRGPRPALSTEQITDAAIALADADGLAAVSMARVAESLGVTTMALYRYVANKDELLTLMSDAGATPPPASFLEPGDHWRTGLERWTIAQLDLMLARPWLAELALFTLPVGPHRLAWLDRALAVLAGTGLPAGVQLTVVGLLSQHVLGEARMRADLARMAGVEQRLGGTGAGSTGAGSTGAGSAGSGGTSTGTGVADATPGPAGVDDRDPFASFDQLVVRVADPATYPALHRTATEIGAEAAAPDAAGHPGDETATDGRDDETVFGIRLVLDGVEALVERHRAR